MPKPIVPSPALILRASTLAYLGLMVVLPLVALTIQAVEPGPSSFWKAVVDPFAWHAIKLTFATALVMVAINALMGTATAWVLVRYDFPGKGLMNALIDLPFAVPTVVTGLMLVALYGPSSTLGTILGRAGLGVIYQQPGIVLALLFVTYPFVIRSVQPVLLEIDRGEEEAAATLGASPWTIFRRVTLPTLFPSILTGTALAFSRALGEFGSVVMVAGNRPLETKTGPMYVFGEIESGNRHGAMVVSVVLLAASLGILITLNLIQRGRKGLRTQDSGLRTQDLEFAHAFGLARETQALVFSSAIVADFRGCGLVRGLDPGPFAGPGQEGVRWGIPAVLGGVDLDRRPASFRLDDRDHATGHDRQHAVRAGVRDGPGSPAVLGPGSGRWFGRPAFCRLADHRGLDAGDRLRSEGLAGSAPGSRWVQGRLRASGDGSGDDVRDRSVRGP